MTQHLEQQSQPLLSSFPSRHRQLLLIAHDTDIHSSFFHAWPFHIIGKKTQASWTLQATRENVFRAKFFCKWRRTSRTGRYRIPAKDIAVTDDRQYSRGAWRCKPRGNTQRIALKQVAVVWEVRDKPSQHKWKPAVSLWSTTRWQ